eukprot:s474_g18.t1
MAEVEVHGDTSGGEMEEGLESEQNQEKPDKSTKSTVSNGTKEVECVDCEELVSMDMSVNCGGTAAEAALEDQDDDDDNGTVNYDGEGEGEEVYRAPNMVPKVMEHLPAQYQLIGSFIEAVLLDPNAWKEKFYYAGAVQECAPSNPKKQSTCGYILRGLPTPNLGPLPRDAMIDELRADDTKESKQRRDIDFPCLEQAP